MYSSVSHVRELAVTPRSHPPATPGLRLGGMRILAGLCSLLLLLAPAARPVFADDIVVDDAAPTVQVTGEWATSTVSSGFVGAGYRYRVAGDGSSSVTWPLPASASAGTYEVFARWTSGPNRASNATYVVTHAAGTAAVTVDQRSISAVANSVGTPGSTATGTSPRSTIHLPTWASEIRTSQLPPSMARRFNAIIAAAASR